MAVNDPIADMLTRIRNAVSTRAKTVNCLNSKVCRGIATILQSEGYINSFDLVDDGRHGLIKVHLKYSTTGEPLINQIKRVSKPGCRVYSGVENLDRPLGGLGISIVSTSHGVLSDRQCREQRAGGELLCTVY